MATADFKSLLSTPMDEIKRPPTLPQGTYHGIIASHKFDTSTQKKTPYVEYAINLLSAGEDVDADQLKADEVDLSKRPQRVTFYLTEDARYRCKEFLESCGVPTTGRSLGECIPEVKNARVIVAITVTNSDDGKTTYNNVASVRGEE